MRCTGCGLLYVETLSSDRRLHKRVHSEVVDGPRRRGLFSLPICYKDSNRSVVVIDAASPHRARKIAQDVSYVAAGDVDLMGLTYAATERPDDRAIHLFLGVEEDRARAYMCVEMRRRVWQCTWADYARSAARPLPDRVMWSVGYAWVCRGHRRKGWSRLLLAAARNHLHFGDEFGWYAPFTPDGKAFVRSVCPDSFYIAK